jgi:hypothetical protein
MADKRTKGRKLQAAGVKKDWLTELAQTLNLKPAPAGWYTITQISERLGVGRAAVRTILNERKASAQRFYQVTSDGRKVLLTHYQL